MPLTVAATFVKRFRPLGSIASIASAPLVLGFFLLFPPAHGQMLVLPMASEGHAALIRIVSDPSVRIIGRGPVDGSLIVYGERSAVRRLASGGRVLIIAVPDVGCFGARSA